MDHLTLSHREQETVRAAAAAITAGSPYDDFEAFLAEAYRVVAAMPSQVLRRLISYGTDPHAYGALVVSNLPIDIPLPPTPLDGRASSAKQTYVSEACILAVALVLGQPLGYRDEKGGDIIQALAPVSTEAHATSSESSDVELAFHTDFNFDSRHPDRPYNVLNPDYIALLGLRGDRYGEAYTLYADARDICRRLDPAQVKVMREERYQFAASYSFTGGAPGQRIWSTPSRLLSGPEEFPEISVDLLCGVRGLDAEASATLDALREVCAHPGVSTRVLLGPGDLLIIDNRKGAHARTAFRAHHDGRDRWLHRVYVRRSLAELREAVNGQNRVF
jgi:L-asparagine oxygenase